MTTALLLLSNPADDATIAASTEAAAFPVENVQDERRSDVWRSGSGTSSYIDLTFGSTKSIGVLAFVDLNLTTGGSIRVQSWSDAIGGASPGLDETYSPTVYRFDQTQYQFGMGAFGVGPYSQSQPLSSQRNRQITIIELDSSVTDRYWRITFTDANTSYQQLARLYMTLPTRYDVNIAHGWRARRAERSPKKVSLGGQRYVQRRDARLVIDAEFDGVTDQDRTNILLMIEEFGEVSPVIFSISPTNDNEGLTTSVYGTFEDPSVTHRNTQLNRMPFTFVEEF